MHAKSQNLGQCTKIQVFQVIVYESKGIHACCKKGDAFFVYALPTTNAKPQKHEIPSQYKDYKNVFKKKNVDILPKHQPYDCAIDLKRRCATPYGPIYNL